MIYEAANDGLSAKMKNYCNELSLTTAILWPKCLKIHHSILWVKIL